MKKISMLLAMWLVVCFAVQLGAQEAKKLKIAVIPKGTTHEFWKSIHAGAEKAAQEMNVEVTWQGPQKEDDRLMQIQVVQNFISRGADAIVLAPLDEKALVKPVESAVKNGIKVVIIDSALASNVQSSFVATDNEAGGKMAAQQLATLLGDKGNAIMLRYAEGSASTMAREKGFMDEIAKHPNIKMLSSDQYGGVTRESSMKASQNMLNRFADVQGIFCPNESTTFGMLRALQMSGKAGKVKFVGFDASADLLTALEKGEINGLVAQNPFNMGYLGVKMAAEAAQGKQVPPRVDTGVVLVTKDNLADPKIQEVIKPDLAKWLK